MFRRVPRLQFPPIVAIAALLVSGAAAIALFAPEDATRRLLGDLWNPVTTTFGAVGLFCAARRCSSLNNPMLARAWWTMAVAVAFYACGSVTWSVLEQGFGI